MVFFVLGIVAIIAALVLFFASGKMQSGFPAVIGIAVLLLAGVMIFVSCTDTVPTGHTGILSTFGAIENTPVANGLNFHKPWQTITTMTNKEQSFSETNVAFSKDLQEVSYTYTVKYALSETTTPMVYRTIGRNYFDILVKPQVNNSVKAEFGVCNAENMTATRNQIQANINKAVEDFLSPYGITATVFLDDFDFTDAYTNAVEAKQVAEQEALRDKTQQNMETERARQLAERTKIQAENDAAIRKINADADADAARVKAQADFDVAQLEADAIAYKGAKEAEATLAMANAVTDNLVAYEYAQNWRGELPQWMMGSSTLPIVNIPMPGMEDAE